MGINEPGFDSAQPSWFGWGCRASAPLSPRRVGGEWRLGFDQPLVCGLGMVFGVLHYSFEPAGDVVFSWKVGSKVGWRRKKFIKQELGLEKCGFA